MVSGGTFLGFIRWCLLHDLISQRLPMLHKRLFNIPRNTCSHPFAPVPTFFLFFFGIVQDRSDVVNHRSRSQDRQFSPSKWSITSVVFLSCFCYHRSYSALESAIIQMKTGHNPRTELWFSLSLSVFSVLICTKSDAVQLLSAALPQLTCVQLPSLYSTENEWQRAAHSETFAVMWVERNADSGEGDVLPPPPPTTTPPPALAIIAQCNVRPAFFPWKRSPA